MSVVIWGICVSSMLARAHHLNAHLAGNEKQLNRVHFALAAKEDASEAGMTCEKLATQNRSVACADSRAHH